MVSSRLPGQRTLRRPHIRWLHVFLILYLLTNSLPPHPVGAVLSSRTRQISAVLAQNQVSAAAARLSATTVASSRAQGSTASLSPSLCPSVGDTLITNTSRHLFLPLVTRVAAKTDLLARPRALTLVPTQVATADFAASTSFLYTGSNPVQIGISPTAIADTCAAVLRGKTLTRAGTPLAGVTVNILGHPEYGSTQSRADGMFDLAVNGGGLLTVRYQKDGYLLVQRQVQARWQDYAWLPDVALISLDTAVTAITPGAATMQVAQGSVIKDEDGTRRATLLFAPGTQVSLQSKYGHIQALPAQTPLHVRATEYTVGSTGPMAMPGNLPGQSGYTYAVAYTVDEATNAGATRVQFSQPVVSYVENFLHFPVGSPVPAGYYDPDHAAWVPSDNGRVIQVLSITGGLADVDADGDQVADDASTLQTLGITDVERKQLAGLYAPGTSLWRVSVGHFTDWDFNWPFAPPKGATAPGQSEPSDDQPVDDPCTQPAASVIECQNQMVRESVPVVGTPFTLNYHSGRVPGRAAANTLDIPINSATLPISLKQVELEIQVAGQRVTERIAPRPNGHYVFAWNGQDAYKRTLHGRQPVFIRIGYTYDGVYLQPSDKPDSGYDQVFGHFSYYGAPATGDRARQEVTIWQDEHAMVGSWDTRLQGLGGWSLDALHTYDPRGQVLYLGDGSQRSVQSVQPTITTIAGTGQEGFSGDGGPATQAQFSHPRRIAFSADGSLFVADRYNHRIRRIGQDGIITTVAGTGQAGFSGDGGPATQAQISYPLDVAVGSDGSLFIADAGNYRVRRVGPDGIISTVAGTGAEGSSGDGGLATEAQIGSVQGLAVDMAGSVYLADADNGCVRRIEPGGTITTIAQGAAYGISVAADGTIYLGESFQQRVVRIAPDGTESVLAGTGNQGYDGDGGPAADAKLARPDLVAFAPDGSLYVTEYIGQRVRRIDPQGNISTFAGAGTAGYAGDGGPAPAALLSGPSGIAVGPDGNLYIADHDGNRIRKVSSPLARFSANEIAVPSEDGSELYQFSAEGRHLRTLNALTGATVYEFTYTPQGVLSQITDGDNNVTTIERDATGAPTAIVGPYGQRTVLSLDTNGYLATVANPAGETVRLTTTSAGLLTGIAQPDGHASVMTYDPLGRLTNDQDAAGGVIRLARTDFDTKRQEQLSWKRSSAWSGEEIGPHDANGRAWSDSLFDDTTWTATTLPDSGSDGAIDDHFYRAHFASDGATPITLHFVSDDGLKIFINGKILGSWGYGWRQIGCVNPPGGCAVAVSAPDIVVPAQLLQNGDNVIAVDVWNGQCCNYNLSIKLVSGSVGHHIAFTNALGQTDSYTVDTLATGTQRQLNSFASGTSSTEQHSTDGIRVAVSPQRNVLQTTESPDPRFGMLAPLPSTQTSTTPGGLTTTVTSNRTVTLADPNNTLSLQTQVNTVKVNNRTYTSSYDAATHTFIDTSPQGRQQTYTIDSQGRVTANQVPGLAPSNATYDTHGRLTSLSVGSGDDTRTTSYTYTNSSYLDTITDPLGRTVHFAYDVVGRVTQQTLTDGSIVAYSYDANGNLTSITPPGRAPHTFTYTPINLLATTTAPGVDAGSSQTQYTYNAGRQLTQIIRPDGKPVGLAYDNSGRLQTVMLARGQIGYAYDATTGQVISATAPGGLGLAYRYDGSLATGVTWIGAIAGNVDYTYDNNLRVISTAVNNRDAVGFQYDNDNLLTGAGSLALSHDPKNGLLTGSTLYSINDAWNYNSFGEPTSYGAMVGTSGLYSVTYTRDKLGRIAQKVETIGGVATTYGYAYDPANRLVGVTQNGITTESYTYDANGNRLSGTLGGNTTNGSYDAQDRLTSYGGTTYAYTANGELQSKTQSGQTTTYQYDELGNLIAASLPNGTQITYLIDGQSRRIGKQVNGTLTQRWLYDGQLRPIAELDSTNAATTRFVYATRANVPDYMSKNSVTYRIITDQLGSPRLIVNAENGQVAQRLDYDAFGNVTQDTNPGFQPFGFAGGVYDRDTKLVRFGARDYDARVGRWTVKDPIGFNGGDSNVYSYVGMNPVDRVDLSGLSGSECAGPRPIIDPNTDSPYPQPEGMNIYDNVAAAKGAGPLDMMNWFASGRSQDYQRPNGYWSAVVNKDFQKQYTDVTFYNYGAVSASAGYSLEDTLENAGIYNRYLGKNYGTNAIGLRPNGMKSIAQGWADEAIDHIWDKPESSQNMPPGASGECGCK